MTSRIVSEISYPSSAAIGGNYSNDDRTLTGENFTVGGDTTITNCDVLLATGTPQDSINLTWDNDATITGTQGSLIFGSMMQAPVMDVATVSSGATFPAGHVIQHAYNQTGAVATGTTNFPEDDTIPQITEGDEFLTQAITPKSASSTISIEVHIFYSQSTGTRSGCALFKDSNSDALAFTSNYIHGATSMGNMQLFYAETSGNTTARTYRVRCGLIQNSGTFTLNGQTGSRKFGGVALSTIRIMEISG